MRRAAWRMFPIRRSAPTRFSRAQQAGMTPSVVRRFSSEPAGTIVSQDASSGLVVSDGQEIRLVVSVFPKVPSLVGLSLSEARQAVETVSLRLVIGHKRQSVEAEGTVLRQRIAPHERVPARSKVQVTIVFPHVCGSPLNPWCFSVSSFDSLIYNPPLDICSFITCIPSFWDSHGGIGRPFHAS